MLGCPRVMAGDKHMLKPTFSRAVHAPKCGHEKGPENLSIINPLLSSDFIFLFDGRDWSKTGLTFNLLGLTCHG